MSTEWVKDIIYCNSCDMLSIPHSEESVTRFKCAKCNSTETIRLSDVPASFVRGSNQSPSEPMNIPQRPARLESPNLTPNMAPAFFAPSPIFAGGNPVTLSDLRSMSFFAYDRDESPDEMGGYGEEGYTRNMDGLSEMDIAIQESMETAPSPELKPADPELLKSMNRFRYVPQPHIPTTCAICMDDFEPEDEVVETICCKGVTHHDCMDSTLCVIPSCPFCRNSSVDLGANAKAKQTLEQRTSTSFSAPNSPRKFD